MSAEHVLLEILEARQREASTREQTALTPISINALLLKRVCNLSTFIHNSNIYNNNDHNDDDHIEDIYLCSTDNLINTKLKLRLKNKQNTFVFIRTMLAFVSMCEHSCASILTSKHSRSYNCKPLVYTYDEISYII